MGIGLGNACSQVARATLHSLSASDSCGWEGAHAQCVGGCINVTVNMSQSHLNLKEFHLFYLDVIVTSMCLLAALSCQVLNYEQHLGSHFFLALLGDRTL